MALQAGPAPGSSEALAVRALPVRMSPEAADRHPSGSTSWRRTRRPLRALCWHRISQEIWPVSVRLASADQVWQARKFQAEEAVSWTVLEILAPSARRPSWLEPAHSEASASCRAASTKPATGISANRLLPSTPSPRRPTHVVGCLVTDNTNTWTPKDMRPSSASA
jgi:hypothetical protein